MARNETGTLTRPGVYELARSQYRLSAPWGRSRCLRISFETRNAAGSNGNFPSTERSFAALNPRLRHSLNASQLCCTMIRAVYNDAGNAIETHEHKGDFKEP